MAKHRGVKFLRLSGGRTVVRWRDPVSGKQVQRDCEPLGLTNDDKRRRWAIAKAGDLRDINHSRQVGRSCASRRPGSSGPRIAAAWPHTSTLPQSSWPGWCRR
jgi:hypothetical protein